MIDFHVHAYPDASSALRKLAPGLPTGAVQRASSFLARGLRAAQNVATNSGLKLVPTIEGIAALQKKLPGEWGDRLEQAGSIAVMGSVLLAGTVRLLASMERTGIRESVVIAAPKVAPNQWLLQEACPKANGRLIPVTILPDLPTSASKEEWGRAFAELAQAGARGFKIHPNYDGLDAGHAAYRALFEVAEEQRRFVILHTGCFHMPGVKRPGEVDVQAFEHLFRAFPRVNVCLAHMNRQKPEIALELLAKHPQLFSDTSWQPQESLRRAIQRVGVDRLVLGSDWPLLHLGLQEDALQTLARAATDEQLETITTTTPARLLKQGAQL